MKNKLLISGMLLLLTCPIFQKVRAQNAIFIRLNNGNQNSVALNSLNKITFSSTNLFLNLTDASTSTFAISDISKITFGTSSGVSDIKDETVLSVYPNPASDFIKIKNLAGSESLITIYRIDGAIALQKTINNENQTIDISGLSNGLYLLQTSNKTLKFTKR
ncbi:MAG: T9SS type A sorting domain-containing protein [Bacteroidota bacterium]|nr:T9SS type A sorting domain-containing protein [Bacteroidota bacterium]